jgi:hypothetical protein
MPKQQNVVEHVIEYMHEQFEKLTLQEYIDAMEEVAENATVCADAARCDLEREAEDE